MSGEAERRLRPTRRATLAWLAVLYFASGIPLAVFVDVVPVFLRQHGVNLASIGLLSALGTPWSLKVFWSPLVDRWPRYQWWIAACLAVVATALAVLARLGAAETSRVWLLALFVVCFAGATQDIAIDAYSIQLVRRGDEGVANGVRQAAYRIALMIVGGASLLLVAPFGWPAVFHTIAVTALVLAGVLWLSPRAAVVPGPAAEWARALGRWLKRPRAAALFLFALTYKLGDASMGPMIKPFWVDRGLSPAEIGMVSTTAGALATIAGALVGGWYTSRAGISRALFVLGLAQALSNLGYALVAAAGWGRYGIYAASLTESFTGGLGSAAFLAFLMRACERERAATEYALLSALFAVPRQVVGATSGWLTQILGYPTFFALTFVLALPALLLIPRLRPWVENSPP
ncbi:MAG: MFS transporter [Candidatus Binatia bacterium]|nr:MFS transporter [Candidatus Binatia bacterium]